MAPLGLSKSATLDISILNLVGLKSLFDYRLVDRTSQSVCRDEPPGVADTI
jgi:hypothetical protein